MIWRCTLAGTVLLTTGSFAVQPEPDVGTVLNRMHAYLIEYESELSSVVAEEHFSQRIDYSSGAGPNRSVMRRLESEVGFIRLPGDAEWLGFRDVRKLDGRPVKAGGPTVSDVLVSGKDLAAQARAIAQGSARHNLGLPRTVNVPTAPLDIIHPRHFKAMAFTRQDAETVHGTRTVVIGFVETGRPTLVREPTGIDLVSSGKAWVDPVTGIVWRVEWSYQAEKRLPGAGPPPRLRVDFAPHPQLAMMVPTVMTEVFAAARSSRAEGRATYKNFRRFGTSARIIPQP